MTNVHKQSPGALVDVSPQDQAAFHALGDSQFVPFFQPVVTLRTGQLAGFEVLARWEHPTAGVIPPSTFIAIAERDGWIDALTQQILVKVFAAASIIPDPLTLAINVSAVQLRDLQLLEEIESLAENANFKLSRLVIEITESAVIEDLPSAIAIVAKLKAMKCKLALDDFGTGYSSLHHLQSLPFDQLKVDRSFVSAMIEKRDSRKIVAAVVGLGQSLGLTTVAEGIETQEQAEMMLWLGCELGQGYFYGRPLPAEELTGAISAHREKIVANDFNSWNRISAAHMDVSPSQRLAQLQAIYDGAPVGLAFVDQNLRYVNLNKKLADMNGASVESHLGALVSEMIPELFPYVESFIRRGLAGEAITDVEAKFPSNGVTRLVSYQPAIDEAGEVVGVAVSVTDITERKRMEEALKASEVHYRSMVELNPQVLWIMDPQGRNLDVTPRWDKLTGRMKAPAPDPEWLTSVHPEDLHSTVDAIADFRRSGSPIDVQYRVEDGDGGWRWKRSLGSPRFDVTGNIVCWYGSVQDIPAPRNPQHDDSSATALQEVSLAATIQGVNLAPESNAAMQRRQALLELQMLDTPVEAEFDDLVLLAAQICDTPISLVSLVDSERQWFKAFTGLAPRETPIDSSFCAYAIEQQGLFLVEDTIRDERFRTNPLVVGDPRIRFYAGMPLYAAGVAVGTLCVIDTVPRSLSPGQVKALAILSHQVQAHMDLRSERRKLQEALSRNRELAAELTHSNQVLALANSQLESLETTDLLTGIPNRRVFEDRLMHEYADAVRKQHPLSVLIMDIDNFMERKNRCGRAASDEVLRHVGTVTQKVLRVTDCAARIGGEEFGIILPDANLKQARLVAERIQELLGTSDAELPSVTLSIGISSLEEATASWSTLVAEADFARYEAKRSGENRFVIYENVHVA